MRPRELEKWLRKLSEVAAFSDFARLNRPRFVVAAGCFFCLFRSRPTGALGGSDARPSFGRHTMLARPAAGTSHSQPCTARLAQSAAYISHLRLDLFELLLISHQG